MKSIKEAAVFVVFIVVTSMMGYANIPSLTRVTDPLYRQLVNWQQGATVLQLPTITTVVSGQNAHKVFACAQKLSDAAQELCRDSGCSVASFATTPNPWSGSGAPYGALQLPADKLHAVMRQPTSPLITAPPAGILACGQDDGPYCTAVSVLASNGEIALAYHVVRDVLMEGASDATLAAQMLPWRGGRIPSPSYCDGVDVRTVGWPIVRFVMTAVGGIATLITVPLAMLLGVTLVVRLLGFTWPQIVTYLLLTTAAAVFARGSIGVFALVRAAFFPNSPFAWVWDIFNIRDLSVVVIAMTSFVFRRFWDFNHSPEGTSLAQRWDHDKVGIYFMVAVSFVSFCSMVAVEYAQTQSVRSTISLGAVAALAMLWMYVLAMHVQPVLYRIVCRVLRQAQVADAHPAQIARWVEYLLSEGAYFVGRYVQHKSAPWNAFIGSAAVTVLAAAVLVHGLPGGRAIDYANHLAVAQDLRYLDRDKELSVGSVVMIADLMPLSGGDMRTHMFACALEQGAVNLDRHGDVTVAASLAHNFVAWVRAKESVTAPSVCAALEELAQTWQLTPDEVTNLIWEEIADALDTDGYSQWQHSIVLRDGVPVGVRLFVTADALTSAQMRRVEDVVTQAFTGVRVDWSHDRIVQMVHIEERFTAGYIAQDWWTQGLIVAAVAFVLFAAMRGVQLQTLIASALVGMTFVLSQAGILIAMWALDIPWDIGTSAINDVGVSAAADLPAFALVLAIALPAAGLSQAYARGGAMHDEIQKSALDFILNSIVFAALAIVPLGGVGAITRFGALLALNMLLVAVVFVLVVLPLARYVMLPEKRN